MSWCTAPLGVRLGKSGRSREAEALLRAACADSAHTGALTPEVLAAAHLAELIPAELPAVEALLERSAGRLEVLVELEVRLTLLRVTGKREHRDVVRRVLEDLLAKNPDHRESMLLNVPLVREAAVAVGAS